MGTELTYQERLNRFEIAQETIGFMMAHCTHWIDREQRKPTPDATLIAQWEAEFGRLFDEQYHLRLGDDDEIERVLAEYGPILKARYELSETDA